MFPQTSVAAAHNTEVKATLIHRQSINSPNLVPAASYPSWHPASSRLAANRSFKETPRLLFHGLRIRKWWTVHSTTMEEAATS